eukprot:TRINITY_DN447_c0_g1_i8.p1 TRINITY_DN447_c0_g1~~TRINITY_DN447_c0_g1_i8.p1  ORF type:complete len:232 (+),score=37.42 TRINITY_DN447_c0_g1_i8:86-697(+)
MDDAFTTTSEMNTDDDTNARTSSSSMNTDNGEGDEFEQDSTTTTTDTTTTSSTSSSSSAAASDTKLKTNTRGATSSDSNSFGMNADFTQNGDSVPQPSDWIQENYNLSDADFQHLLDIENNTDDWDHATCKNGVDIWKQQVPFFPPHPVFSLFNPPIPCHTLSIFRFFFLKTLFSRSTHFWGSTPVFAIFACFLQSLALFCPL